MNLIDVHVTKILEPPHQVITDELCCWEVKVETDCYGCVREKVFRRCSKKEIDEIKPGYWWSE